MPRTFYGSGRDCAPARSSGAATVTDPTPLRQDGVRGQWVGPRVEGELVAVPTDRRQRFSPGLWPGPGSTMIGISVTFDLSEETLSRLEAEAARRGVSIDEVIAELAARLPAGTGRRPSFAGIGGSGWRDAISRRNREIIAEEHSDRRRVACDRGRHWRSVCRCRPRRS